MRHHALLQVVLYLRHVLSSWLQDPNRSAFAAAVNRQALALPAYKAYINYSYAVAVRQSIRQYHF